ncbi:hypothetical protein K503DRAFT_771448 [Rhizopogon vinicolor AM-OR11-026]|uniref:Uncharacterized protein n=1 Tax=Rhizopogon vinicolor AM-OR11-026 TaxID=1314800 RepID=A0A1B7MY03_9AGAM|nr:hypothetical protein K503DRAFT_771448 [Rhizopogon vinicolor AM-OR11-026]
MQIKFEEGGGGVGAEELTEDSDVPGEDTSPVRLDKCDLTSTSGTVTNDDSKQGMITVFKDNEQLKKLEALSYIIDISFRAVKRMRVPLSILFFWILAFVVMHFSGTLRTAFTPICYLPFVSKLALCAPLDPAILRHPKWADFPLLMEVQSSKLEQLLEDSFGGSELSLKIGASNFPTGFINPDINFKPSHVLADLLTMLDKDAKKTAGSLIKLSSKAGSAVDNVIAVNEIVMRTIQDAEKNAPSTYSLTALNPFHTGPTTQEIIVGAFTYAMDTFSVTIQRLILEAEVSLHNLDTLEEEMLAVREAVTREVFSATDGEILKQWYVDAGERHREKCSRWLKDFGDYQKQAQAHVIAALQTLNSMSKDIGDLRERVAAPELVGGRIAQHVHIWSIQNGLQRLREVRVRAKEREDKVMGRGPRFGAD